MDSLIKFFTNPVYAATSVALGVLSILQSIAAWLISLAQRLLLFVLQIHASSKLLVIDASWAILRDMCNMVFIVILVAIAFATVFNVMGIWKKFYWKTALVPLLVGAILINFSLAIGQTIMLVSDQVMQVFITVQPNLGDNLIAALNPNQLLITAGVVGPANANPSQITNTLGTLTAAEQTRLAQCLKETKPTTDTGTFGGFLTYEFNALNNWANSLQGGGTQGQTLIGGQVQKGLGDCNQEILAARAGVMKVAQGQPLTTDEQLAYNSFTASAGVAGETQIRLLMIFQGILNVVALFMLASCLITAGVFLILRIFIMWALLFLSPLAWLAYAMGNEGFKTWWKHFMAWNMFGPLYLFLLLPGMIMIRNSGSILNSLAAGGAGAGFLGGAQNMVSMGIFYGFALIIFLGALSIALSSSYASTIKTAPIVGKWAQNLGVFSAAGLAPLRVVGQKTGITPNVQAALERIGERTKAQAQGRFPRLFGPQEEALEKARARFGVSGGATAYEKAIAERVKTQNQIIEAKNLDEAGLRRLLSSSNRDERLAAGEALLKKGKLTAPERSAVLQDYAKISPVAQKEFQKRLAEQGLKEARKQQFSNIGELITATELTGKKSEDRRKFLEAAMQGEAGQRLRMSSADMNQLAQLMDNPEDQRAFFEAASKSGRNKVAAIETMANLGLIVDRNGRAMRTDEALADKASSLSGDDLLDAEDFYNRAGRVMPAAVGEAFKKATTDPKKFPSMVRNASDPAQLGRLYTTVGQEQVRSMGVEQQIKNLEAAARKLKSAATDARNQYKKSRDAKYRKLADQIDTKLADVTDRINKAKKTL